MIKLIFPFSQADIINASLLANRFTKMGDMHEREILVTCCWKDHFGIEGVIKALTPHFKKVEAYVMPDVPFDEGWPQAPNHMFYNSCLWLAQHGNPDPFYFFEADCFPLWPGWLDEMEQEYTEAGKPYYGFINDTWMTVDGESKITGKHMVGTGVYPADFLDKCEGVHTLDDVPWDIAIRDEVIPECHGTQKIHHAWSTGKYRYLKGELIAEPLNKWKRYGGPVNPEAVVIHGCKDQSLYRLTIQPRKLPS